MHLLSVTWQCDIFVLSHREQRQSLVDKPRSSMHSAMILRARSLPVVRRHIGSLRQVSKFRGLATVSNGTEFVMYPYSILFD
jgi:hypothetical protein